MKYDPKYNTPGYRQKKKEKDAFGQFKKRIDQERTPEERRQGERRDRREKPEEEPLWLRRSFQFIGIPAIIFAAFSIGYLVFLNVSDLHAHFSGKPIGNQKVLTTEQIEALPEVDQYVYYGRQYQRRMQYREAWKSYRYALSLEPEHPEANSGMYTTLLGLVKKDDGWKKQLREQERRMEEMKE